MFCSFGRYCNGFLDYGRFPLGGVIMGILGIVLAAAVIYFIWKGTNNSKTESPLELLQRRFVNGEISAEEYQTKKSTLHSK